MMGMPSYALPYVLLTLWDQVCDPLHKDNYLQEMSVLAFAWFGQLQDCVSC